MTNAGVRIKRHQLTLILVEATEDELAKFFGDSGCGVASVLAQREVKDVPPLFFILGRRKLKPC